MKLKASVAVLSAVLVAGAAWAEEAQVAVVQNIAYNTLPATMTADFRGLRYLTSPNQSNSDARGKAPTLADDGPMQVMNPRDHHCCQHNVASAWPYFAESLYEATPDRGLAAMMYAPCTVTAQVGDGTKVTIEQKTRYPFEERVERG